MLDDASEESDVYLEPDKDGELYYVEPGVGETADEDIKRGPMNSNEVMSEVDDEDVTSIPTLEDDSV